MNSILAMASLALCFALSACGGQAPTSEPTAAPAPEQTQSARHVDMNCDWKQKNSMDEDAYQLATIRGNVITINRVANNGDTKSIYWVGTFKVPKDGAESFVWTSKRDASATDNAIMASDDSSKKFTFSNDEISYEAGIMGTTTTMRLGKQ